MFEIEKKFHLTETQRQNLLDGAEFIGVKQMTDVYFDTPSYKLTTKDMWLRKRDDVFELKVALPGHDMRVINQYDEITQDDAIREKLNIQKQASLDEDLIASGYMPFVSCHTTRRKYKKDGFNIDIDHVDYDSSFDYELAEIEVTFESEADKPQAIKSILDFAKAHHLTDEPIRGKVVEYLIQERPEHYKALVDSGVIKE
ncbi:MAG: CYTH domain-containing protein [Patescibacteria group bacterium]